MRSLARIFLASLFMLGFATEAFGIEGSGFVFSSGLLQTSLGFSSNEFDVTTEQDQSTVKKDVHYAVSLNLLEAAIDGLRSTADKLSVKSEITWGRTTLDYSLGFVSRELSGTGSGQTQTGIGEVSVTETFKKFNFSVAGGEKIYADMLQSDYSLRNFLRGPFVDAELKARPYDRWRFEAIHHSYFISDGNRRANEEASILYALSSKGPSIWLGGRYELLQDSISSDLYWSPRQITLVGPKLDLAIPIYGGFSFSLGYNLLFYRDIDFGSGTGYYGLGKIIYGKSTARNFFLGLESSQFKEAASNWSSTMVLAGLVWPL